MDIGGFALGGTDEHGNKFTSVLASAVPDRLTTADLPKPVVEQLQFCNFAMHAQLSGHMGVLDNLEQVAADPPDFKVRLNGQPEAGVELTTLGVTNIARQRLAEMRQIALAAEGQITADRARFSHLNGRVVTLAELQSDADRPPRRTPAQREQLVDNLLQQLEVDFGTRGIPVPDGQLPQHIPAHLAQLGIRTVEDYLIYVDQASQQEFHQLQAAVQISIDHTELRETLLKGIDEKDKVGNDILLISTGRPDIHGQIVPADAFVFQIAREMVQGGLPIAPTHLSQIILHHWNSPQFIVLFDRAGGPKLVEPNR
ncbi:hypothetical protein [Mycolicibacterium aichiense]|uniref:Uncharacterized protein n=1 Tax=Mycolicibacterium aichiense TaxID=1799 RepID=A0AAD1HR88_9MYCO|nr:hypothetical protein [Mycolicibacterium aichiense]MCV7016639.1 hypothetical protein [Mycolicibacterium aichiense]BBX09581.1 hypothetical protein MAIC_43840 [Mycolicibacterium aichiense]SUA14146.1 Uncharacterised protein [Mycolicibacterium aichiense]